MFWADALTDETIRRYRGVIDAGKPLIVRDEKTASGRVHVACARL
jgi:hypothetical protein